MATLRYNGQLDTSFHDVPYEVELDGVVYARLWRIGDVTVGQTFSVPDEVAERFTRRDDIELVDDDGDTVSDAVSTEDEAPAVADGTTE